jgi:hypothetical protein
MRTADSPQGAIRVRINDIGIGMPPGQIEDINRQLSESADAIDLASSRMMGLVVVARLAKRHDVRVELRPGEQRGTVAEVIMGDSVLTDPKLPERGLRSGVPLDGSDFDTAALNTGDTFSLDRDHSPRGALGMNSGALPQVPESPAGLFDTVAQPGPQSPPPAQPQPMWQPSAPQQPSRPPVAPPQPEPLTGEHQLHRGQSQPSHFQPVVDEEPGFMFRPGGLAEERRPNGKVMEVTGEIVSSEHVALPKIQLEAFTPEPEPVPPSWPDAAAAPAGTEAPRAAKKDRVSALDATTELPIFREVESAWFKAVTPAPKKVEDDAPMLGAAEERPESAFRTADEAPAEVAEATSPRYADQSEAVDPPAPAWEAAPPAPPQPTEGSTPMQSKPADEHSSAPGLERRRLTSPEAESGSYAWRTAADDGWSRVDNAFAETVSAETTSVGLPKRRPMERLVPGAVEESQETVSAQKRNPEGIRGLLSAYHRGVQRGRGNDGN